MNTGFTIFSLTLIFFLIMDPIGNVKACLHLFEKLPTVRRKTIIVREGFFALIAMLLFNFLGEYLFSALQINKVTVYLASGLILFLAAIKILFPKADDSDLKRMAGEPYLVPLAIPIMAGPALLATIMLYASTETNPWETLIPIFIAWAASLLIYLLSKQLLRVLGTGGLTACEKLMGMILVLMSVQRMLQGVILFYVDATSSS